MTGGRIASAEHRTDGQSDSVKSGGIRLRRVRVSTGEFRDLGHCSRRHPEKPALRSSRASGTRRAALWRQRGLQAEAIRAPGRADSRLVCIRRRPTEAQDFAAGPSAEAHLSDVASKSVGGRPSFLFLPAWPGTRKKDRGGHRDADGRTNRECENQPPHGPLLPTSAFLDTITAWASVPQCTLTIEVANRERLSPS